MRYAEDDNLHMDFHGATNTTIDYLADKYGEDALHQVLFKTGRDVYKSIRQKLSDGDTSELKEHWQHFFKRENAVFEIEETEDGLKLTVTECPAVRHVKKLGLKLSSHFCDQTVYVNKGICDQTPFEIETTITGEGSCTQILRNRES